MPTCIIRGCKNRPECTRDKDQGITFHRFPIHKPNLMKKWFASMGSNGLKDKVKSTGIHNTSVICSEHFEKCYLKTAKQRTRLLPEAIPTLFNFEICDTTTSRRWVLAEEGNLNDTTDKQNNATATTPAAESGVIKYAGDLSSNAITTATENVSIERKPAKAKICPPEDDEISLVCLSPAALAQQVVVVPGLLPLTDDMSPILPTSEKISSRKRKLQIPSLCLDTLRGEGHDSQQPEVSTATISTDAEPALEKLVILRAKSKLPAGKKKKKKYPTRIPAEVIKGKKKIFKPSVSATKKKIIVHSRPEEDIVCVADVFAAEQFNGSTAFIPYSSLSGFCRVCANGNVPMIAIFESLGRQHKLAEKIHRYLPIQVTEEDKLPLQVCTSCVDRLNACEQLADCCHDADLKLRLLLDAEDMHIEVEEMLVSKSEIKREEEEAEMKLEETLESTEPPGLTCVDCGKYFERFRPYARHCYTVHKRKKCKSCDKFFLSKEELFQHKLQAHGIKCDCCGESFVSINSQLTHLRKNHPEFKSYTCELCGKSFNSKYGLAIHSECHQLDRPFLCDTCGKNFKSKRKLKVHKCVSSLSAAIPENNTCTICQKVYTLRSSLQRHMIRHSGERRFECIICHKKFFGSVNLKNHMVIHEKATLYECQMCCARYFHKRNMISHLKEKHSTPWNYKCPSCDQIFQTIDDVVAHRKIHDIENISLGISQVSDITQGSCLDFQCKICAKYFENIYVLTYHFEDHVIRTEEDLNIKSIGDDGIYECNYCGEKMVSNWTMKRHIKKFHSEYLIQPQLIYNCGFCERRFASKQQLRQHVYQHTGEKPYRCRYCDAGFRTQLAVKVHSRTHTGETPYHCLKCPKKFRSSATLRIHQGIHDKPFCCPHCGQRFPKKSPYQKHVLLHTSDSLQISSDSKPQSKKGIVYKCKHCDYVSKTRAAVKKHESNHEIEPTYLNL